MAEITDRNLHEVDPHFTARIVESYVRHHTVGTGQVSELITSVHGALAQLGRPSEPEEVLTPAVSIPQSVRQDYVVCLDCGYRAKTYVDTSAHAIVWAEMSISSDGDCGRITL